jgi:AcrR family transcriptional regulator
MSHPSFVVVFMGRHDNLPMERCVVRVLRMTSQRPYHHGDLRAALLRAAVETIEQAGLTALTLRHVARRAAVTHTAAAYHFGDKAGLLTAVAVDGYRLLGDSLGAARRAGTFLDIGVGYVEFAVTHRAYFEVMFRPELLHRDDGALLEARARTAEMLYGTHSPTDDELVDGIAAWAIVHGFATLWLHGNVPSRLGSDPLAVARTVAARLRPPSP